MPDTASSADSRVIRLGNGFTLPAREFVTGKFAVIGQSGRGKSGLLKVMEEELLRNEIPFVHFDPAGVAWGIKSSYDGTKPSNLPVIVIGGDHADLPLQRTGGAEVARAVVRTNVSVVIDVSTESKAVYAQFATDFCDTIFGINRSPRHIFIDEAKDLVPQGQLFPEMRRTFHAVERLVRVGRNRNLGTTVSTQRSAAVSKDVLEQCASLCCFGVTGTRDLAALREWVDKWSSREAMAEFLESLASLQPRECYFWSPSAFGIFKRFRVNEFHTLHPDLTHLTKLGLLEEKVVTTDVSKVITQLGASLAAIQEEKTAAADAPRLRARLKTLEAELAVAKTRTTASDPAALRTAIAEATKPLREQLAAKEKERFETFRTKHDAELALDKISEAVRHFRQKEADRHPIVLSSPGPGVDFTPNLQRAYDEAALAGNVNRPVRLEVKLPRALPPAPIIVPSGSTLVTAADRPAGTGEKKILAVLARRPAETMTRRKVAILTRYAWNSGTFGNYLGSLRSRGWISGGNDAIRATPVGIKAVGPLPPVPSTHAELMADWEPSLDKGGREILKALESAYPEALDRVALAEKTGYAHDSGTFGNYIGRLKTLGLVEKTEAGFVLSATLYPD